MVKSSGGRSKAKGSGGGPGSAPSSPTRRLKKGGKRGRRLCHRDGCTLCPSFGFDGDVAVSCSHHKEEGMRNLTARRCQHEGCFTVANFGFPGDKPGYCAAHSTDGMVNRNKPRGSEGLLHGLSASRTSRRASKANNAEATKAADPTGGGAAARKCSSSGGKESLLRGAVAKGNGGGLVVNGAGGFGVEAHGASAAVAVKSTGVPRSRLNGGGGRWRTGESENVNISTDVNNENRGLVKQESVDGSDQDPRLGAKSKGMKTASKGKHVMASATVKSGHSPSSSLSFRNFAKTSRGGGGGGGGGGVVSCNLNGNGSGHAPAWGGGQGLRTTAVTSGVLRRQDAFLSASRSGGGGEAAGDLLKRYAGGGGVLLGGVVGARNGCASVAGGVGRARVEYGFHQGNVRRGGGMMDGHLVMGGSFLESNGRVGEAEVPPSAVDAGEEGLRNILLGTTEVDMPAQKPEAMTGGDGRSFADRPSGVVERPGESMSQMSQPVSLGLVESSVSGRVSGRGGVPAPSRSNSFASVMVGGGGADMGGGSTGVFFDLALDPLPELNSNDLTGLCYTVEAGPNVDLPRGATHQQQAASTSSAVSGFPLFGLQVDGQLSSPSCSSPSTAFVASAASSSSVVSDGSSEAFSSSSDASLVSVTATVTSGSGKSASPGLASSAPSAPVNRPATSSGDALMPTKMTTDDAWWELVEGEEFVAMPEPAWGGNLETQDMQEESLRGDLRGWHLGARGNGGGGGGRGRGRGGAGRGSRSGRAGMMDSLSSSSASPDGDDQLRSSNKRLAMVEPHEAGGGTPSQVAKTRSVMSPSYSAHLAGGGGGGGGGSGSGNVDGAGVVLGMPSSSKGLKMKMMTNRVNQRGGNGDDHTGVDRLGGACYYYQREDCAGAGASGGNSGRVGRDEGGGKGGIISPLNDKFASRGEELDTFPSSPFRPDGSPPPAAARAVTPRELGCSGSGVFSSAASSPSHGIYPANVPVSFGLTVLPPGGGTGQSQVPLPHGGAGMRSMGQGSQHHHHHQQQDVYGGDVGDSNSGGDGSSSSNCGGSDNLGKTWISGDTWATVEAISPSKCLSLSPAEAMLTSPSSSTLRLFAQSTPPWGGGPICSPQQQQQQQQARATGLA